MVKLLLHYLGTSEPGLRRFAQRYMVPYLPWYAGGIVTLALTNWISVTIPLYVGAAIDEIRHQQFEGIAGYAVTIALLGAVVIGVRTLSRVLFFTPGRLVEAEVKRDLFERLLQQQPNFHRNWPPGDLVSRITSDVNFLRLVAGFVALSVVNTIVAVLLTFGQMVRLSPTLALWSLLPIGIGFGIVQIFIQRMFTLVRQMQIDVASLSDHILSSYQGVATIKGFDATAAFVRTFDGFNDAYLDTSIKRADMRAAISPTLAFAGSVNVFLLLFIGGPMAIRGEISVGDLVAFTALLAFLQSPLRSTSFLVSAAKQAQAALERIDAVMDPEPDRPDLPNPAPAPQEPPGIEVKGLCFSYPDAPDVPVLVDVSFSIRAGGTLGILGPTGSGKTTILRCLARLYNPPPGTVFVDGVDIRRIDLDGWREHMAFVPQRAFLFSESLRDNVLLGRGDDSDLRRVLELTAMDVDIDALPHGIDTQVGESGLMLSGGQRQRTALARGLVREPAVLMLDDVLSAVDHATEGQLIASLRDRDVTPTTVIVANRVSALQHADCILVLGEGRVVEQGRHDELCERAGPYRETWLRQSQQEAPA